MLSRGLDILESRKAVVPVTIVILALIFAYLAATWKTIDGFVLSVDHCDKLFCDFAKHYYPMGREIFASRRPVHGYFYSPFFAFFLSVYSALPRRVALQFWGAFQYLFTILLGALPGYHLLRESRSPIPFYLYLILFSTSLPVFHNLKWGQVSTFVTFCLLGTLYAYRRNHRLAASILLSVATAIKYYPIVFIVYFIAKKDYRFVAYVAVCLAIFLILLPFVLIGPAETVAFYRQVQITSSDPMWTRDDVNSQSLENVIPRIVLVGMEGAGHTTLLLLSYLVIVFNVILVLLSVKKKIKAEIFWAFGLTFLSTPFALKTSWPHYFVYLPFCQAFLTLCAVKNCGSGSLRLLALLAPIGLSAALSSIFVFNAFPHWSVYSRWGCLFFSNFLLLGAAYLLLIPQLVRAAPQPCE